MTRIICFALLAANLALFPSADAKAQENAPGWEAFVNSDFETALEQSKDGGTADSYALACRSATVVGGYFREGDEAVDYLHQAIRYCEKALELEPTHLIGKMTYAMTVGFEGKRLTSPSYASVSKRAFEALPKEHPGSPMARAAIAGWHSEVHAAGFLARLALGPSLKEARNGFMEAFELGEVELPLRIEYAKFLARGKDEDRKRAIKVLEDVIASKPAHGFERLLQSVAEKLIAAIESGKKRVIKKTIEETSAFYGIEDWDNRRKLRLTKLKSRPVSKEVAR